MNLTDALLWKPSPQRQRRTTSSSLLFLGDSVTVALCMAIAFYLRYVLNVGVVEAASRPSLFAYSVHYSAGFGLFFLLGKNQQLYDINITVSMERATSRIVKIALFWAVMYLGASLILKLEPPISRLFVGYTCILMCLLLPLWRLGYLSSVRHLDVGKKLIRHIAIIGCTQESKKLVSRIREGHDRFYDLVGVVTQGDERDASDCGAPIIGSVSEIDEVLTRYQLDAVAVADAVLSHVEIIRIAKACERRFVEFNLVPGHFEVFTSCLALRTIGGVPVLGIEELPQHHTFSRILKRLVDVAGALVGLAASLPLMPVFGYLIWRESPGPIIYKQVRTGERGRPFTIYKLRSMKMAAESDGKARWCTRDDPRRLAIGTFMRKWNIDELPQFWNVLKGDMSLVGPRPERPELISAFLDEIPYYQSRHTVKPGMTGWAQVHGLRGDTSLQERIRYDLQYIENWSLWLDFVIKYRTLFNYKNAY